METKILIRFDDICPTMDWTQWDKAAEVLEQYHINCRKRDMSWRCTEADMCMIARNVES